MHYQLQLTPTFVFETSLRVANIMYTYPQRRRTSGVDAESTRYKSHWSYRYNKQLTHIPLTPIRHHSLRHRHPHCYEQTQNAWQALPRSRQERYTMHYTPAATGNFTGPSRTPLTRAHSTKYTLRTRQDRGYSSGSSRILARGRARSALWYR